MPTAVDDPSRSSATDHHPHLHLLPKPSLRGWSHFLFSFVALVFGLSLIAAAPNTPARIACAVYVFGVMSMLTISSIYHRIDWSPPKKATLLKADHTGIYLCVAGSYTPICIIGLRPAVGIPALVLVWAMTIVGLFVEWWPGDRHRAFAHTSYLVIGWVAMLIAPFLWWDLGAIGFFGIAIGGLLYTAGAIFHALKWPNPIPGHFGFHEVFHAFTIAALAVHYVTIRFVVLPLA